MGTELMSIFIPQVEPYKSEMCFLPKTPLELGREAWSKDMDVIFGGTANEGFMFYFFSPSDVHLQTMKKDSSLLLLPDMREGLNAEELQKRGQKLNQLYFKSENTLNSFVDVRENFRFEI